MSSSLDSVKPLPYDYAFMNHISSMIKIIIRKNFVYFNQWNYNLSDNIMEKRVR